MRLLIVLAVAAGAAVAGYAWHYFRGGPEPPAVDLEGADPPVAKAVGEARDAARRSPRSAAAWGRLGMVLMAHDYYNEAEPCFARAERLGPDEPRWPYYQGLLLLKGNPEEAVPKLQRAADLCPGRPETPRLQLGEALLGLGRLDEAEALFRRVLEGDARHPRARLALGRVECARGRFDESVTHLTRAAEHPATRKAAHLMLAEVRQRRGDATAAARERTAADALPDGAPWPDPFFEEMLSLQQGRQALLARSDRLLDQGRAADAVNVLRQAARQYADAAWVWLALGRAHLQAGDVRSAESAFRTALRHEPDLIEGHFYMGVALFERDRAAAAKAFRRATELKPDYAVAHFNLGQCLAQLGDRPGAGEALRTAVRCKPHYAEAHADLADLLAQEGRKEEAGVHLRAAEEMGATAGRAKDVVERVRARLKP